MTRVKGYVEQVNNNDRLTSAIGYIPPT